MTSSVPDAQHTKSRLSGPEAESARRARELFEQAEEPLESDRPAAALSLLQRAAALDPEPPRIRSRLALAMVRSGSRFDEARAVCEEAVKQAFDDAGPYLDLARLYLEIGRRPEALRCLRRGRMIDPGNETIAGLLDRLGERRPPVIASLPRRHVLNRMLGVARARLARVFGPRAPTTSDRGLESGWNDRPGCAGRRHG